MSVVDVDVDVDVESAQGGKGRGTKEKKKNNGKEQEGVGSDVNERGSKRFERERKRGRVRTPSNAALMSGLARLGRAAKPWTVLQFAIIEDTRGIRVSL